MKRRALKPQLFSESVCLAWQVEDKRLEKSHSDVLGNSEIWWCDGLTWAGCQTSTTRLLSHSPSSTVQGEKRSFLTPCPWCHAGASHRPPLFMNCSRISPPMNTVPSENIYLLHHGFFHRLQGNLCSGAWNTSPFCSDLCACRAVSHTFFPCSSLLWNILPFLKNVFKEVPPSLLMGPAASYMSCFGVSWLQPCPAWGTPGLLSQRSLLQSPADKILPHKSRDRRQYFFHWELDHDFESLKA